MNTFLIDHLGCLQGWHGEVNPVRVGVNIYEPGSDLFVQFDVESAIGNRFTAEDIEELYSGWVVYSMVSIEEVGL